MDTFVINEKSWHYRLATFMNSVSGVRSKKDFCSYVWSVIGGIFRLIVMSLAAFMFLLLPAFIIITNFFTHWWTKDAVHASLGIFVLYGILLALLFSAIGHSEWKDYRFRKKERAVANGTYKPFFIKAAYRALKDKVCMKVSFPERNYY